MTYTFELIGTIETCFKEKFGIPRQPGLVKEAHGVIRLTKHPFFASAIVGLNQFSHLWLVFVFHQHGAGHWKPSVRPPRLGGAKKVGVLASRSPHRPNPIGISLVKLKEIRRTANGEIEIWVSGVDILDGTPILDIKPYLPYADHVRGAKVGWAKEAIKRTQVRFSTVAISELSRRAVMHGMKPVQLKRLIKQILELDPRPAFQQKKLAAGSDHSQKSKYGFRLLDMDVKWEIRNHQFVVLELLDFIKKQNPR